MQLAKPRGLMVDATSPIFNSPNIEDYHKLANPKLCTWHIDDSISPLGSDRPYALKQGAIDQPILIVTPQRGYQKAKFQELEYPTYINLALDELNCFETIEHQFSHWGIKFSNTIALIPSNPAFNTRQNGIVLMGAPKSGLIELYFTYPVSLISANVTSSRRTVLSAFDREGNLISQSEIPTANLAGSQSSSPADTKLIATGMPIYQASFYAFDGQLVIADLCLEFAPVNLPQI